MVEPLEKREIPLANGNRRANATVGRFENGWTLLWIDEAGFPRRVDHDSSLFKTFEELAMALPTIWLP